MNIEMTTKIESQDFVEELCYGKNGTEFVDEVMDSLYEGCWFTSFMFRKLHDMIDKKEQRDNFFSDEMGSLNLSQFKGVITMLQEIVEDIEKEK